MRAPGAPRILVTGAAGELGRVLVSELRRRHGPSRVLAVDKRPPPHAGPCAVLDVEEGAAVRRLIERLGIAQVYHLAAVKSAEAERRRAAAWNTNINGLYNVLEALRPRGGALFFPSSVAAGAEPTTLYGVTKRAGELLCGYYRAVHGVDARSLRLPCLLSSSVEPGGGGAADFPMEMAREARGGRPCRVGLAPDTSLPFLRLEDGARAVLALMTARPGGLTRPVGGAPPAFMLSPRRLARLLARAAPGFAVEYEPDPALQAVADSWAKAWSLRASPGRLGLRPPGGAEQAVRGLLDRSGLRL